MGLFLGARDELEQDSQLFCLLKRVLDSSDSFANQSMKVFSGVFSVRHVAGKASGRIGLLK